MINKFLRAIENHIDRSNARDRALNLQAAILGVLFVHRREEAGYREDLAALDAINAIEVDAIIAGVNRDLDGLKACEVRLNELR